MVLLLIIKQQNKIQHKIKTLLVYKKYIEQQS